MEKVWPVCGIAALRLACPHLAACLNEYVALRVDYRYDGHVTGT